MHITKRRFFFSLLLLLLGNSPQSENTRQRVSDKGTLQRGCGRREAAVKNREEECLYRHIASKGNNMFLRRLANPVEYYIIGVSHVVRLKLVKKKKNNNLYII